MKWERRDILKMFGVTGAAMASTDLKGGTKIEAVRDSSVAPLPPNPLSLRHFMDVQRAQLYSAIDISSGQQESRHYAFNYGLGQHTFNLVHGATISDTNMCMAHCLPAPEVFCVERVGVVFSPVCDAKERSRFIEQHALSVWIADKVYWRGPLADIFAVDRIEPPLTMSIEFPVKAMANLKPLPLILETQMYFKAEVSGGAFYPESPLRLWVVYDGLHARGVQ